LICALQVDAPSFRSLELNRRNPQVSCLYIDLNDSLVLVESVADISRVCPELRFCSVLEHKFQAVNSEPYIALNCDYLARLDILGVCLFVWIAKLYTFFKTAHKQLHDFIYSFWRPTKSEVITNIFLYRLLVRHVPLENNFLRS
jgi:hypothetical protein